ncbi:prolyl oligopeptidase family serine peptidase [Nonomuraea salmonea]|uniref:prolyl oligopeptidase family serine peptidase n=1 Tax=Nonomuraea salmonea TaxID=46181 RepID=UPI0031E876DF
MRGGGEMGRHWYEQGKLTSKRNTFTDFVAAARHMRAAGWSSKIVARGGSAGGLLMGAATNLAPRGVRRDRGRGAVRGRAQHHPRSVASADRDRMGRVGRPAAQP